MVFEKSATPIIIRTKENSNQSPLDNKDTEERAQWFLLRRSKKDPPKAAPQKEALPLFFLSLRQVIRNTTRMSPIKMYMIK